MFRMNFAMLMRLGRWGSRRKTTSWRTCRRKNERWSKLREGRKSKQCNRRRGRKCRPKAVVKWELSFDINTLFVPPVPAPRYPSSPSIADARTISFYDLAYNLNIIEQEECFKIIIMAYYLKDESTVVLLAGRIIIKIAVHFSIPFWKTNYGEVKKE